MLGIVAMVLLGAAAELATVPRADIAYLLYAAGRVVDGARLYVDVVEINPPLIVALNLPVVVLARAIGASDITAYRVCVTVVLLGLLAFADWCLRHTTGPGERRLRRALLPAFALALFVAPGVNYGQREHLLFAMVAPYLFATAGRLAGHPLGRAPATAAGLLAGVGLALKPQFLLLWIAVEAYAAWRRRSWRLSAEAVGVPAVFAAYLAAVLVLTPEYFGLVGLLGTLYATFGSYSFLQVVLTAPGLALVLLAVLAFAALRREAVHPELWNLLLVALAASFLAAAAQRKGWGYHFYPSFAAAVLLLTVVVADVRRPLRAMVPRLYAAVALAALGTTVLLSTREALVRVRRRDPVRQAERRQLDELAAAVRRHAARGETIYAFSYSNEAGFPLVNLTGLRWASRFPHLWILPAAYQEALGRAAPLRYRERDEMAAPERYLNEAVYEDLARYRPDLLLVLRHARDVPENAHRRLDYIGYFSRDPRIAAELRSYRLAEEAGEYLLYVRARGLEQPGETPTSRPGRYDLARPGPRTQGEALRGDPELLLAVLGFVVLTLAAFVASSPSRRHGAG